MNDKLIKLIDELAEARFNELVDEEEADEMIEKLASLSVEFQALEYTVNKLRAMQSVNPTEHLDDLRHAS